MKKLIKIILLLLCLTTQVHAKEYSESFIDKANWISGDYVNKQKGNSKKYQQMYTIKRKSDNKFVYCIEPGVSIKNGKIVKGYDEDYIDVTKFTEEQWDRITKLAYYGYGYKDSKYDHTGIHWYTITQFMIWKTVPNGYDIYFTDKLNGKRITKYEKEIKEMEEILVNYHKLPSFNNSTYTFGINKEKKVVDTNNVLSSFNMVTKASNYSINNNQITFNINDPGIYNYELSKSNNKYGYLPIVYMDNESQNLMSVGDIVDDKAKVSIKVEGGKVIGHKLDYDTLGNTPQGEASLLNAVYGIYDSNNNLVEKVNTNDKGEFISRYLDYGNYYIQEITPSKGYLLDTKKYSFTINDNNKNPVINLFEKVIMGKLEIIKYSLSNNIKTLEPNAKFQVYDKKNKLYKEAITDKNGYLVFNLPYGTYTIKQVEGLKNYKKVDDFTITISKEETIKKELIDVAQEAKVKVIKIDSETNKTIKQKGITFKIFDIDNNKYYCENDNCTFTTNAEGVFLTQKSLLYGNYKLEEINTSIEGYYWNKDPLTFKIDNNLNNGIKELKFYNKPIKGKVIIKKIGEEPIFDNNSVIYKEIDLSGIKFNLYAKEDIIYNNEIIIKKDEVVTSGITDNKGELEFNNLYLGNYYLVEDNILSNYEKNDNKYDINLNYIDQSTEPVININVNNYLVKGTLEFSKIDLSTSEPLPNTLIEIYNMEDKLLFSGRTNNEGRVIIKDLPIGKYYILEKEAPKNYLLNNEKMYFEIKDNSIVKATMKDERMIGNIIIKKIGEEKELNNGYYTYKEVIVPNVAFGLYAKEDIINNGKIIYKKDTLIKESITNKEGIVNFNNLYLGKYYIKELKTLESYVLDNNEYYIELESNNEKVVTKEISFKNYLKKSTFEFTKTSISDSEPLPNTLMEFYDIDNNLILSERTNEEGKITLNLPYGKYYYIEKEAPKGYEINPDKHYFEILEDNIIIKDVLFDDLIKVPDTYKNYSPLIIVVRLIILGGILVIIKKNY